MAWETRKGKGSYFTRTARRGGRRRRIYFGSGEVAELASTLMEIANLEQELSQKRIGEEDAIWEGLEWVLEGYSDGVDLLARASLVAGGYHSHKSEWRRRRHGQ